MDLGLRDRVAVVLASSEGLGRACARALASEGAKVALCARRAEPLARTADEIRRELGVGVYARPADVTDAAEPQRFVGEVIAQFGRIDILIHNNGGPPAGTALAFDDEAWRKAVEANFLSGVRWSRAAVPLMRSRKWGRVLFITSITVKQPSPELVLSNAARAGLTGYARTLAREVAADGVLVHVLCPGAFRTARMQALGRNPVGADVPIGRIGEPEELGAVAAFLCSERASYVTGTALPVDGGSYRGLT